MIDERPVGLRIDVDLTRNILVVDVSGWGLVIDPESGDELTGQLDIGTRGQLIGIEFLSYYVTISDPERDAEHLIRSVDIPLTASKDSDGNLSAISFRRSGDGYELSFPSGNRCWQVGRQGSMSSASVCSVVIG